MVLRLTIKDQKVGRGSSPRNLCPFPEIAEIILSLISLGDNQAREN